MIMWFSVTHFNIHISPFFLLLLQKCLSFSPSPISFIFLSCSHDHHFHFFCFNLLCFPLSNYPSVPNINISLESLSLDKTDVGKFHHRHCGHHHQNQPCEPLRDIADIGRFAHLPITNYSNPQLHLGSDWKSNISWTIVSCHHQSQLLSSAQGARTVVTFDDWSLKYSLTLLNTVLTS